MNVSKNMLENNILKKLAIHHALSDIKLKDAIGITDNKDSLIEYNIAISNLLNKGCIDIVKDIYNMSNVIRLKAQYH